MPEIHLDFETRSTLDLKKVGVHAYAEFSETDAICVAWGTTIDNVQSQQICGVERYRPPRAIVDGAADPSVIWYAHNAAFERQVWKRIMTPRYGWPQCPPVHRWRCTMAQAYAMALPGRLELAAAALGLPQQKDNIGYRLMKLMCAPKTVSPLTWHESAEQRTRLAEYCRQDVRTEINLTERVLPLDDWEQSLWELDQIINDRGIYVDEELCDASLDIIDKVKARLHVQMAEATDGAVTRTDQTAALRKWLADKLGVEAVDSIAKGVIDDYLGQQLPGDRWDADAGAVVPGPVRRALTIRREAGKASVAKVDALLESRSRDMRARGLFQYHAASTGRWAGRRFQPHNLKRPQLKPKEIKRLIDAIVAYRDPDVVELYFGEPLSAIGDVVRSMVTAAPGKTLYCGDFANIEGRGLAWGAGEERKLEVFRQNDIPLLNHNGGPRMDEFGDPIMAGPDPYLVAAAGIYGVPVTTLNKKSPERQVGKVAELALGYQGGLGAFHAMAGAYGVVLPDEKIEQVKTAWRKNHPEIVAWWREAEDAAVEAVLNPGREFPARRIAFKKVGSFLFMMLPSERRLCYPYPRVEEKETPWGAVKPMVTFMGTDTKNGSPTKGKWTRLSTYGGKLVENAVQAIARDVLAEAIVRLEDNGYPVVMHVHDEAVSEPSLGFGDVHEFEQLMAVPPAWARGFPIKVEAWTGHRYRKG